MAALVCVVRTSGGGATVVTMEFCEAAMTARKIRVRNSAAILTFISSALLTWDGIPSKHTSDFVRRGDVFVKGFRPGETPRVAPQLRRRRRSRQLDFGTAINRTCGQVGTRSTASTDTAFYRQPLPARRYPGSSKVCCSVRPVA